jgi:glycosyltransferase involved in cell wall biosynthesis
VSVVLPTYNERDSIQDAIKGFAALGIVDDILVINNNAAIGTSEEVAVTSAREVFETRQGYGAAIQRGLREVNSDLVCICEPDGTFHPQDLMKLLAFTDECDFVIGSRTVSNFVWSGANMGWHLRWGNWAVAKLVELLFNTAYLSDVGCTFRVLSRDRARDVLALSESSGSSYGLEMLLLAIIRRARVVQVPVNYHERVGTSSVTGDLKKTFALGFQMLFMVLRFRTRRGAIRRAHPLLPPRERASASRAAIRADRSPEEAV